MANLYIVSTPIGNLKDITLRAIDILREVDYIFCEDTRITKNLLIKYGIGKPLLRHDNKNEKSSANGILKLLNEGKNVALLSDAGTPLIADPGFKIVQIVSSEKKHKVIPIPGATAFIAAASVSGLPTNPLLFIGFLDKKQKKDILFNYLKTQFTIVFYESPLRIKDTISIICDINKSCKVCVAREISKIHEQIVTDTATNILSMIGKQIPEKGEFTVLVRNL